MCDKEPTKSNLASEECLKSPSYQKTVLRAVQYCKCSIIVKYTNKQIRTIYVVYGLSL